MTITRPLTQKHRDILDYFKHTPRATTRQVAEDLRTHYLTTHTRLNALYARRLIGRQLSLLHGGEVIWSAGEIPPEEEAE